LAGVKAKDSKLQATVFGWRRELKAGRVKPIAFLKNLPWLERNTLQMRPEMTECLGRQRGQKSILHRGYIHGTA
jgi:hypothetical protein